MDKPQHRFLSDRVPFSRRTRAFEYGSTYSHQRHCLQHHHLDLQTSTCFHMQQTPLRLHDHTQAPNTSAHIYHQHTPYTVTQTMPTHSTWMHSSSSQCGSRLSVAVAPASNSIDPTRGLSADPDKPNPAP